MPTEALGLKKQDSEPAKQVDLRDLINKYRSIKDIPDDELTKIGYVRESENHIVKADFLEEERRRVQEEKKRLESKIEAKPFGLIKANLTERKLLFKRLDVERTDKINNSVEDFGWDVENHFDLTKISLEAQAFQKFVDSFSEYIKKLDIKKEESNFLYDHCFGITYLGPFKECLYKWEELIDLKQYVEYDEDNYGDFISKSNAENLFVALEKAKGVLKDVHEIKRLFDEPRNQKLDQRLEELGDAFFGEKKYKFSPGFKKIQELTLKETQDNDILWLLINYFKDRLPGIIKESDKHGSLDDFKVFLIKFDRRELTSYREKESIKQALSKAAPEEKKKISADYKKAQENYEKDITIIKGVVEFLSCEIFIAEYFNREINEIQKLLMAKSGEDEVADFYLDGTPSFELDRDPGKVSGDCTEGRPLPFDNPDIPVYNVKFYNAEKKHIGNIYLLKTKSESGESVWHLEAIQIPSVIDWDSSIKVLILSIGEEARKNNVDWVTVNKEPHCISNYDYIMNAVVDYHDLVGGKMSVVEVPEVDEGEEQSHSSFQGDGKVRIIWENKNLIP